MMREFLGEGGVQCFDAVFAPMSIPGAPDYFISQHFWCVCV
jgi:hypothetical protein